MKNAKKVLMSYIPLFDYSKYTPGEFHNVDNIADILEEHFKSLEVKSPIGIGFAYDENKVGVIFCFDGEHYKDIAEHLKYWLEGDNNRMRLHIKSSDNGYVAALMPDKEKAITRWKAARLMYFEEAVDDDDFEIFTIPISCRTESAESFNKVKDMIREKVEVGFADYRDFEGTIWLGSFNCAVE